MKNNKIKQNHTRNLSSIRISIGLIRVVKKIWHFIGLPDPEENVERKKLTNIQKNNQIIKNEEEKKPVELSLIHI